MQTRFTKKHVNYKKYRIPSPWIVLDSYNLYKNSFFVSASQAGFLYTSDHIKSISFYIKKIIGRKARTHRPHFLIKPRYWLTSKAKASRMGKGKGNLDTRFFFMSFGAKFISLPMAQQLTLIRLIRSLRVRLPFNVAFFDINYW